MKFYAGIGSRDCPENILKLITDIGAYLVTKGYTLRSGGADGADTAFEKGCDSMKGPKEIYLNKVSPEAVDFAAEFHPAFDDMNPMIKLLIARNGYQVLGLDLKTPVRFIVCWTPHGRIVGGTGQALRIAMAHKIPVINLGKLEQQTSVLQWMALNLDFLENTMYNLFDIK